MAAPFPVFPRTDGEPVAKADHNTYDAALDAALRDTLSGGGAGSSQLPGETTAEVRDARGNLASLSERLEDVVDADGVPLSLLSPDTLAQTWMQNLLGNDQYLLWSKGDSVAPDYWTLAGGLINRTGPGLADETTPEFGQWATKLTSLVGDAAKLEQDVVPSALIDRFGSTVANGFSHASIFGRVKCSTGGKAMLVVKAGVESADSAFHTGDGQWQTLAASVFLGTMSRITATLQVQAGEVAAHFSPVSLLLSPVPTPKMFIPSIWRRGERVVHIPGAQTASATVRKFLLNPRRPMLVTDVQLGIETAPTGAALIVDIQTWNGSSWTSMFSTPPQIASASFHGAAQPDGTYRWRCLVPMFGATVAASNVARVMVTQVGSIVAGSDLTINVGYLEPARPLEGFYSHNTV